MRVIAGRLGGRSLRAPRGAATRPTSDRVREALFAVLGDLQDVRVADLYAGSGALGIEALSRGASHVVFVDAAGAAIECIRANLQQLQLATAATVVRARLERARAPLLRQRPFDLVLCDPPWAQMEAAMACLRHLPLSELVRPGSRVVVEHSARGPEPNLSQTGLQLSQRRVWGDSATSIFRATGHLISGGPAAAGDGSRSGTSGV